MFFFNIAVFSVLYLAQFGAHFLLFFAACLGFCWDRWFIIVDEKGNFVTQRKDARLAFVTPSIQEDVLLIEPEKVPDNSFMSEACFQLSCLKRK